MKIVTIIKRYFSSLLLSKTAKNTYLVFLGNSSAIFLAFLFTIILVRLLSVSDFGYFSALLSFMLLFADISDVGIGNSLSSFLPPLKKNKRGLLGFIKMAFFLQFTIAFLLMILIFVLSDSIALALFHDKGLNFLINITGVGIFIVALFNFFQYAFSAQEQFTKVTLGAALGGVLRLFFLGLLVLTSRVALINILWIQNISFIILVIVALGFTKLNFFRASGTISDFKKLISFSSYIGIARALTAIVSRLDVLMLIALRNPGEAGIYSIAAKIISVYPLFSGSFTTVIAPKIASINNHNQLKKYLYKVFIGTLCLIISIVILITIASPFMITLFGEKSRSAIPILQVLLISMIFFVGSIPAVSLAIYYLKKPQILTINSILQLLIVIPGNLYFIPRYGSIGPAFSLIGTYGITLFSTTYLSFYYLKKKEQSRKK